MPDMGPETALPISAEFASVDEYVTSLLEFATSSDLFKTLCGGVHVLDLLTSEPSLYSVVVPESWRDFFGHRGAEDILDLLMREPDLDTLDPNAEWRGGLGPPSDLVDYIKQIRRFSLRRDFHPIPTPDQYAVQKRETVQGMKVKKAHEVDHFSRFAHRLMTDISHNRPRPITHCIDFGSGQGYLPRRLAAPPYNKHMVAVESKAHNIIEAKFQDETADMKPKARAAARKARRVQSSEAKSGDAQGSCEACPPERDASFQHPGKPTVATETLPAALPNSSVTNGSIQHVEHWIADGDLTKVVQHIRPASELCHRDNTVASPSEQPNMMVISLHSCGNLVHHGIRSLLMNPTVSAVALVGCCYNLMTERLGPPTFKLPSLRTNHPRLAATSNTADPHGFPMSSRYCNLPTPTGKGLRLNITARMMAVQAPQNWSTADSDMFFTRHFYRATLQRILFDLGLVEGPASQMRPDVDLGPDTIRDPATDTSAPVLVGGLGKPCYANFLAYVRGAANKLSKAPDTTGRSAALSAALGKLSDADIVSYEERFGDRKIDMSVLWSLMAFSAGVVEALIVVDRYLFLKEQPEVQDVWIQTVFDYKLSPRNLVVVGIKK